MKKEKEHSPTLIFTFRVIRLNSCNSFLLEFIVEPDAEHFFELNPWA